MKRTLFIFGFLTLVFQASALYTIKGKVIDSGTKSPIDFANVALIKTQTETPAAGVTTDENGSFVMPQVPNGKYTLRISFVGYTTLDIPLVVTQKELDLGNISLLEDSKSLTEIEVMGQGSQMSFEIDRKVFSVDKNIASAGGSASDVLQNIPSVDVDGEGNVSLRNNSSVEVWINGKPSGLTTENRAQVLQQMPAESIDKVEIITNPSAKFNPEGTAGIINIVLKKNRKAGYYGSVSAGATYVDKSKITPNLGVNINHSSGKWDAYLNIGYRSMDFSGFSEVERLINSGSVTNSRLFQKSDMSRGFGGVMGRAGIDFRVNDKSTFSLSGFGMLGSGYSSSNTTYAFENYQNSLLNRNYSRKIVGDGARPSYSITFDYKYEIDKKGSNIMTSLTFSPHKRAGNETIVQTENSTVNQNFSQKFSGKNDELELKVDYTAVLSPASKIELGLNTMGETRKSPSTSFDNISNSEIKAYYNLFNQ